MDAAVALDAPVMRGTERANCDRADRDAKARARTLQLAHQLGQEAICTNDGWELNPATLYALTKSGGFHVVAFRANSRTASLPLRHLHSVLTACKTTCVRALRVGATHLTVEYDHPGARGRLAIVLHPLRGPSDAVVVQFTEPTAVTPPQPALPRAEPVQASSPRRIATFWNHIEAALRRRG